MPLYVVYGFCSKENCKMQLSNDKLSKHYLKKLNICCFIFSQRTRATVDCKSFPSKHKSIQSIISSRDFHYHLCNKAFPGGDSHAQKGRGS